MSTTVDKVGLVGSSDEQVASLVVLAIWLTKCAAQIKDIEAEVRLHTPDI